MSYKKEKIPMAVRNTVWLKWIKDKNNAKCFCCKLESITTANWHCGHIVSEKNGGKIHLNNLRPICAGCNCSMGRMNMYDFIEKYGFDTIEQPPLTVVNPLIVPQLIVKPPTVIKRTTGWTKPINISNSLCYFLDVPLGTHISRTEVTKRVCNYIKEKNLQDPKDGRRILIDTKLNNLLKLKKGDELTYFSIQRYIQSHCTNVCNKSPVKNPFFCDSWKDAIMEVARDHKKRNFREFFQEIKEKKLYPIKSEDDVKIVNKTLSKIVNNHGEEILLSQDRKKSPYRYWIETGEEKNHQKTLEKYYLKCKKIGEKIKASPIMIDFKKELETLWKMKYIYEKKYDELDDRWDCPVWRGTENVFYKMYNDSDLKIDISIESEVSTGEVEIGDNMWCESMKDNVYESVKIVAFEEDDDERLVCKKNNGDLKTFDELELFSENPTELIKKKYIF